MDDRTCNLLGALALTVTDRVEAAVEGVLNRSGETPSAIVLIGVEAGMSNDRLRQILGMSHAGAVRLVDRLVGDGLVERRPGKDGRAVALHLTRSGFRRRNLMLKRRLDAVRPILSALSVDEKELLTKLLHKVLIGMPATELQVSTICRMCDERVCVDCPLPD